MMLRSDQRPEAEMAKWTVGDGDDQFVIEVRDQAITLSIPSGKPIAATPAQAQDIRAKIAIAIGIAQGSGR
jgi:hypothetical protein